MTDPPTSFSSAETTPSNAFAFARKACYDITLPNGSDATTLMVMETLRAHLPLQTRRHKLTEYKNCCLGRDFVETIQSFYCVDDRDEATKFAQYLQYRNMILHVCDDEHLVDMNDYFFRLQCHHTPSILNSYCIWMEDPPYDPDYLVRALLEKLFYIERDLTRMESDGSCVVGYREALQHPGFVEIDEAICALQKVDMRQMDAPTRTAFGLNLYNLMIRVGFIKLGFPETTEERENFLGQVKLHIGDDILSLFDLEYGVLRGNQRPHHTSGVSVPFSRKDPRLELSPSRSDSRIHFALYRGQEGANDDDEYGSSLCYHFMPDTLEKELQLVTETYCSRDENVGIDVTGNRVFLSKTFDWFGKDLRLSHNQLLVRILEYLRGDKQQTLKSILPKKPKVQFYPYESKPQNADNYMVFNTNDLKPNIKNLFSKRRRRTRKSSTSADGTTSSSASVSSRRSSVQSSVSISSSSFFRISV